VSRVAVARLEELTAGVPRLVEAQGRRIVLARVGDAVYACADGCAHRGGPLSEGRLSGTRLACPWHGWHYDVRTGQCVFPGRGAAVASYPVAIADGEIHVELP
jgi:3-phenylpropionate/trans-cinnamate dioxygenase ferredoxin component